MPDSNTGDASAQPTEQVDSTELTEPAGDKKPWWKRWWGITLIVLLALGFLGMFVEDDDDEVAIDDVQDEVEEVVEEEEDAEREPEPEEEPEPEPEEEPEPEGREVTPEEFRSLYAGVFVEMRDDVANAFEQDYFEVERVDALRFDEETNVITLDIVTPYPDHWFRDQEDRIVDDSWDMQNSWARDIWAHVMSGAEESGNIYDWPESTPAFTIVMEGGRFTSHCPGEAVVSIADRDVTRSEYPDVCDLSW